MQLEILPVDLEFTAIASDLGLPPNKELISDDLNWGRWLDIVEEDLLQTRVSDKELGFLRKEFLKGVFPLFAAFSYWALKALHRNKLSLAIIPNDILLDLFDLFTKRKRSLAVDLYLRKVHQQIEAQEKRQNIKTLLIIGGIIGGLIILF